jgi:hypothetical protein
MAEALGELLLVVGVDLHLKTAKIYARPRSLNPCHVPVRGAQERSAHYGNRKAKCVELLI